MDKKANALKKIKDLIKGTKLKKLQKIKGPKSKNPNTIDFYDMGDGKFISRNNLDRLINRERVKTYGIRGATAGMVGGTYALNKKAEKVFNKLAVNVNTLIKGVKKNKFQILKPKKNFLPWIMDIPTGPHAIPKATKADYNDITKSIEKNFGGFLDDEGKANAIKENKQILKNLTDSVGEPSIVLPKNKKEKSEHIIRSVADKGRLRDGKTSKGINAVIQAHERDELVAAAKHKTKRPESMRGYGHLGPEVILKEHNNIKTLKGGGDTKKIMKKVRKELGESKAISDATGGRFIYGESPRLSRHARKRITELMEKNI